MALHRRTFLQSTTIAGFAAATMPLTTAAEDPSSLIVDVHQHLWDLTKIQPPWLKSAPERLRHTFHLAEYAEATRGLTMKSVYMEVDVSDQQLVAEAEQVIEIGRSGKHPTIAAVIG